MEFNKKFDHFKVLDMQFKLLESQKLSLLTFNAYKDDQKRIYVSREEMKVIQGFFETERFNEEQKRLQIEMKLEKTLQLFEDIQNNLVIVRAKFDEMSISHSTQQLDMRQITKQNHENLAALKENMFMQTKIENRMKHMEEGFVKMTEFNNLVDDFKKYKRIDHVYESSKVFRPMIKVIAEEVDEFRKRLENFGKIIEKFDENLTLKANK